MDEQVSAVAAQLVSVAGTLAGIVLGAIIGYFSRRS